MAQSGFPVARRCSLLLATLASCTSPDPPVGERSLPIVNGSVDTGHPAVVAITYLGASFCTGTLIAPKVVLTASHCIDPTLTMGILVEDMDVFFGTDTAAGGTTVHLVSGMMHPDWNPDTLSHDIACVQLLGPASVEPVKMNTTAMDSGDVGQPLRIVGFGVTMAGGGGGGVKRQALSEILNVSTTTFSYGNTPSQTCFGDSGGPGFMNFPDGEYLVGVTSAGDEDCMIFGIDTRVDIYREDFIQKCLDLAGPTECGLDGVCTSGCVPPDPDCPVDDCAAGNICKVGCTPRDPDCFCHPGDGYCDLGCTEVDVDCVGDIPMGQPCGNDRECQSGLCIHAVDDLDFRYCSRPCPDSSVCSTGIGGRPMPCTETVNPELKVCAYEAPSPGVTGAGCTSGADCWSGLCVPATGGPCGDGATCNMCTRGCVGELGADCLLGYTCQTTMVGDEELHVCLPAPKMEGWCSAAPASRTGGAAALLILLALAAILRRKSE